MLKNARQYRFFYHYFRYGEKKMSVHFRNACYNVDHVRCLVPCETKFNERQPKLVMRGYANWLVIDKGVATIS